MKTYEEWRRRYWLCLVSYEAIQAIKAQYILFIEKLSAISLWIPFSIYCLARATFCRKLSLPCVDGQTAKVAMNVLSLLSIARKSETTRCGRKSVGKGQSTLNPTSFSWPLHFCSFAIPLNWGVAEKVQAEQSGRWSLGQFPAVTECKAYNYRAFASLYQSRWQDFTFEQSSLASYECCYVPR